MRRKDKETRELVESAQNLGYMNGWIKTPRKVMECTHRQRIQTVSNCLTKYFCDKCGYYYFIDSSD